VLTRTVVPTIWMLPKQHLADSAVDPYRLTSVNFLKVITQCQIFSKSSDLLFKAGFCQHQVDSAGGALQKSTFAVAQIELPHPDKALVITQR